MMAGTGQSVADRDLSVLVVDDDEDLAAVAEAYLEAAEDGFAVTSHTDPDAALAAFERGEFDVVVSDFDMPAMDGLAFCEAVREREAGQPCLIFTAVFDSHVPREARERDLGYLEKRGERGQYDRLAERIRERAGRGSTST
jgi:CheY-like chemotaxis protein